MYVCLYSYFKFTYLNIYINIYVIIYVYTYLPYHIELARQFLTLFLQPSISFIDFFISFTSQSVSSDQRSSCEVDLFFFYHE